jgi:hypothetical protein
MRRGLGSQGARSKSASSSTGRSSKGPNSKVQARLVLRARGSFQVSLSGVATPPVQLHRASLSFEHCVSVVSEYLSACIKARHAIRHMPSACARSGRAVASPPLSAPHLLPIWTREARWWKDDGGWGPKPSPAKTGNKVAGRFGRETKISTTHGSRMSETHQHGHDVCDAQQRLSEGAKIL